MHHHLVTLSTGERKPGVLPLCGYATHWSNPAAPAALPLVVLINPACLFKNVSSSQGSVCTAVSSSPGPIFRLQPQLPVSLPRGADGRGGHGTHGLPRTHDGPAGTCRPGQT